MPVHLVECVEKTQVREYLTVPRCYWGEVCSVKIWNLKKTCFSTFFNINLLRYGEGCKLEAFLRAVCSDWNNSDISGNKFKRNLHKFRRRYFCPMKNDGESGGVCQSLGCECIRGVLLRVWFCLLEFVSLSFRDPLVGH